MNLFGGSGQTPNGLLPGWGAPVSGGVGGVPPDDNEDFEEDNESFEEDKAKVIADFDPSSLERGAKALREIDSSTNSKEVLKLAIETEKTKRAEAGLREQQLQQQNIQMRQQMLQQEHEQKQRLQQEQNQYDSQKRQEEAKLKQQMAREKLQEQKRVNQEWLEEKKRLFEQQRELEKRTNMEIEEEKRRTLDYQAKLDRETAKIRASAEADGRIRQERENVDVTDKLTRTRMEEERKTKMEIRKEELAYYASFATGLRDTLTSPERMPWLVGGISAMAFGIYGSRTLMNLTQRFVEARIGKPSLVRETSRLGFRDFTPKRIIDRYIRSEHKPENILKDIVLNPSLENKMSFIGRATMSTKKNNAPYRHVLIHGPPGTGKTLFARSLAKNSNMHYAVVTGGDFAPLGANAVTELHKLFDWAESSNRGMILFIDEADAFLRKGRGDQHSMSENMRNALSAFLFRTGTETNKFMIVLATNVPEALDPAVLDRIDDATLFPLPELSERKRILQLYFKKYIKQVMEGGKQTVIKTTFDEEDPVFDRLAENSEGFSGRQLSKFMTSVQSAVYAGLQEELTQPTMEQILQTHIQSRMHGVEL